MSIKDDIEALEKALGDSPADGPWRLERHNAFGIGDPVSPGEDWTVYDSNGKPLCFEGGLGSISSAFLIAACSPDRIRRVLNEIDELQREVEHHAAIKRERAKLSKALELLKEARLLMDRQKPIHEAAMAEITYFLKENSHE
jgi:hypothetical protein